MSAERIQGLLTERRGIDPASLSRVGMEAAVRRRMKALSIETLGHYADRLVVDKVEFEHLIAAVLVHETSFFRYPASFELLARDAMERLGSDPRATYRIGCVATSTGEEPASAVIALLEAGAAPERVHVEASDVSPRAIEYAREGHYRRRGVERLVGERRRRWFDLEDGGYRLRPEVRRRIRYTEANALAPDFGQGQVPYDAVFCRNLLIYLVPEARQRLLAALERMLRPGGLLLVGHAEVTAARAQGLAIEQPSEAFACRRTLRPARAGEERSRATPGRRPPASLPRPEPVRSSTPPAPPPAVPSAVPTSEAALARASELADAGSLSAAREVLLEALEVGPATVDHYHLLALVESARGKERACEDALRRALYLAPRHYPSLMQLALLHETRGERGRARRLREKAARVRGGQDGR